MPTALKGWCPQCRGEIKIPAEHTGPVQCPNCSREVSGEAAVDYRRRNRSSKAVVCLALAGILVVGLAAFGYVYRGHVLSALDFVGDVTGGRTTAALSLVGGVLVLVWLLLWILFPIVVYLGLKDLRRRTAEVEETTRLCVRHLARLTADHDCPPAKSESGPSKIRPGPDLTRIT
jgi:hypothetical protein